MIYSLIKKFLSFRKGKEKYQQMFEDLYTLSLQGMNIGQGHDLVFSGEIKAMQYVFKTIANQKEYIVFDVGANKGDYSILLNKIFDNNVRIFAFEPSVNTYKILQSKFQNSKSTSCYNLGFGDKAENLKLYTNAKGSGLASIYKRRLNHFKIEMNDVETINVQTIDDFCFENGISNINFLKIDVEGNEFKVLTGAAKMINSNQIDFIQFEFGGCNIDSRTYFQDFFYLLKDKFNIYRIVQDGLFKIDQYKEMYEAFSTTNFLAENKLIQP